MKYPAWPLDLAVLELSEIYHMYSKEFILDEFRGTWEVRILSCASPYFLEYETITGSHGQGWYPHEKDDGDPPVQGGPFCFGSLVANYLQNVGPLPGLKIDIVALLSWDVTKSRKMLHNIRQCQVTAWTITHSYTEYYKWKLPSNWETRDIPFYSRVLRFEKVRLTVLPDDQKRKSNHAAYE